MKNVATRIFAFLLVLWYALSIIGFGVHTCSESNRSFLTSFISGDECEKIHPTESCGRACCSHHKSHKQEATKDYDGDVFTSKTCCSNDYQQIELTGSGQSDASGQSLMVASMAATDAFSLFDYNCWVNSKNIQARSLSEQSLYVGELRPLLSVWRI